MTSISDSTEMTAGNTDSAGDSGLGGETAQRVRAFLVESFLLGDDAENLDSVDRLAAFVQRKLA